MWTRREGASMAQRHAAVQPVAPPLGGKGVHVMSWHSSGTPVPPEPVSSAFVCLPVLPV